MPNFLTREQVHLVQRLQSSGFNWPDIARAAGCSITAVWKIRHGQFGHHTVPVAWAPTAGRLTIQHREEITIVGTLADPEGATGSEAEAAAAADGRSRRFREETRDHRIEIAREAEHKFGRKVSWGVECAGRRVGQDRISRGLSRHGIHGGLQDRHVD